MTSCLRLASVVLLFACTIGAKATPIDFKANVLDPPAATVAFPTYILNASPFAVAFSGCVTGELPNGLTADGCFAAVNRTGSNWTSVQFVFANTIALNSQTPSCAPAASNNVFSTTNCGLDGNAYTLTFSDGVIKNNDFFFVTETGVAPNLFPEGTGTVLTSESPVPEPAPFFLVATGLSAALVAFKLHR